MSSSNRSLAACAVLMLFSTTAFCQVSKTPPPMSAMRGGQNRPGAPGMGGPGGQMRGGGFGQFRGGMRRQMFLAGVPVEVIDSYLKLKPDQKTRVKAIHDKFTADNRLNFGGGGRGPGGGPGAPGGGPGRPTMAGPMGGGPARMGGGPGGPGGPGGGGGFDPAAFQAMMQKRMEAGQTASKQIEGVLSADQKKKVAPMLAELNSLAAGGVPVAALAELKLTSDQKKKIAAIGADLRKQMDAAGQDFSKFREINQGARDKSKAVLTPAQQAIAEKYRPQRGGFGGRPGGGPGGAFGRPMSGGPGGRPPGR